MKTQRRIFDSDTKESLLQMVTLLGEVKVSDSIKKPERDKVLSLIFPGMKSDFEYNGKKYSLSKTEFSVDGEVVYKFNPDDKISFVYNKIWEIIQNGSK